MAATISREAYLETGMDVLAELGYGGLKLAEVCKRLGVTTGSFYHYFSSWGVYTRELIEHWRHTTTMRQLPRLRAEPDPRKRIDWMVYLGLNLPFSAEAAIRNWSNIDPYVGAVQEDVDRERHEIMRESAVEVLGDERQSKLVADWFLYLLIGYEQCPLPPDREGLKALVKLVLGSLDENCATDKV